jgi:hypothetical protein
MYFGLLNTDIVNSFSQAVSADFAVGAVNGYAIIDAEIDFQYQKLLSVLPADVIRMMDSVSNEVAVVDVSGSFSPVLYAQPDSLRCYIVDKQWQPCYNKSIEYTDCMCWQQNGNELLVTQANISAAGNNVYQLLDTIDRKKQNLVLFYDVDQDNLQVKSLKSLLRDMVCCSLGSRIFPVASDTWSIVTYYCEETKKWLDFYENGGYPAEFKKIKPKSPISSMRIARS